LGKNVHIIRHNDDLATTLVQIATDNAVPHSQNLQPRRNSTIKAKNGSKIKLKNTSAGFSGLGQVSCFKGQTRAFLKIQDGCDGYCSYCIIPKTRPDVHSKAVADVIEEAQMLVESGHKEIVLTGIFLGAYGQQSVRRKKWASGEVDKLADLLDKMAEIEGLARIRLSSLEPGDVTERLLEVFGKHSNIMPHFHLSLQSGSSAVLRRMHRQYTPEEFIATVDYIRGCVDRPAITTDIIVGFPGESNEEFGETVELAKKVGFSKMHVFSFSARGGTAAWKMGDKVPAGVVKERSKILRELDEELGYEFRQNFVGERVTILLEETNGQAQGRSERYFPVRLSGEESRYETGELVEAEIIRNTKNGVLGRVPE
jgi:threonylcarbamoyladenosine tRNA methylthiotransferase MtaB